MLRKTIYVVLLIGITLTIIFFVRIYTSSPGFTTEEGWKIFAENKPHCAGFEVLLNIEATWTDAPGRSLCIGILKKNP